MGKEVSLSESLDELCEMISAAAMAGQLKVGSESDLQDSIERLFSREGIQYVREHRASPQCRFDFLVGRVVIETKATRRGASDNFVGIFEQLQRYAEFETVDAIVLITNGKNCRPPESPSGGPVDTVMGKPLRCVYIGFAGL